MASNIEWCDETWNPFVGCSHVSPACDHCYAETMARRLANIPATSYYAGAIADGKWNGTICAAPDSVWAKPFEWKKPKRIFVGSMTDVFHPNVPIEWLDMLFAVMALNPQHTFMVLTKRAERMHQYVTGIGKHQSVDGPSRAAKKFSSNAVWAYAMCRGGFALPNVWLGVTMETDDFRDRVIKLQHTPAAKRFVSAEPMLGKLHLLPALKKMEYEAHMEEKMRRFYPHMHREEIRIGKLDWVICGGESGPDARPSHPDWVRDLRDQCVKAEVPFFFKQWGNWAPWDGDNWEIPAGWDDSIAHDRARTINGVEFLHVGKKAAGHLLDGVEWRQVPEVKHG